MSFVIVSMEKRAFWSNARGWVQEADWATRFPAVRAMLPWTGSDPNAIWKHWTEVARHSFQCGNIECAVELDEPVLICPHCAMPVLHCHKPEPMAEVAVHPWG